MLTFVEIGPATTGVGSPDSFVLVEEGRGFLSVGVEDATIV